MAIHTELPIYRTGVRLLDLAIKAQVQMPRTVKRALGRTKRQPLPLCAPDAQRHYPQSRGLGKSRRNDAQRACNAPTPWMVSGSRTDSATQGSHSQVTAGDLFATGNSYFGLLRQASHSHADQAVMARLLRRRGHVVNGDLTKIYRKKA